MCFNFTLLSRFQKRHTRCSLSTVPEGGGSYPETILPSPCIIATLTWAIEESLGGLRVTAGSQHLTTASSFQPNSMQRSWNGATPSWPVSLEPRGPQTCSARDSAGRPWRRMLGPVKSAAVTWLHTRILRAASNLSRCLTGHTSLDLITGLPKSGSNSHPHYCRSFQQDDSFCSFAHATVFQGDHPARDPGCLPGGHGLQSGFGLSTRSTLPPAQPEQRGFLPFSCCVRSPLLPDVESGLESSARGCYSTIANRMIPAPEYQLGQMM